MKKISDEIIEVVHHEFKILKKREILNLYKNFIEVQNELRLFLFYFKKELKFKASVDEMRYFMSFILKNLEY